MFAQLIQLLFTLITATIGYWFANFYGELITPNYPGLVLHALIILFFAGVGFLLGGKLGKIMKHAVIVLDEILTNLPGVDLMIGSIGLLVGLVIALIISVPFMTEVFGRKVMLFSFFIFGFLGLFLSLVKSREIARYLAQGKLAYFGEKVMDTSAIIDGRILEVIKSGFLEGTVVVPKFVLNELQKLADSNDITKRKKGKRGLDNLKKLKQLLRDSFYVDENDVDGEGVDQKLVQYCIKTGAALVTTDYNLVNVGRIMGFKVLNMNDLQKFLKEPVEAGEEMQIKIVKQGREQEQGIGYLEDGTMVIVENARNLIGEEVPVVVTGITHSSSGKIIFAKLRGE